MSIFIVRTMDKIEKAQALKVQMTSVKAEMSKDHSHMATSADLDLQEVENFALHLMER